MPQPILPGGRILFAAAALAAATLALCYALAPIRANATPATQAGTLAVTLTKTLAGSDVVRVGQLLTFTIRIRNTGTISITSLPLLDEYNAAVLRIERTDPLSSTSVVTPAAEAGAISWTNLPTNSVGGPLLPGQSFDVITVFRAIAPREVTVNRARTGTLQGFGGASGAGGSAEDQGGTEGGRVIVAKQLAPGQALLSGQPITFTIAITNDGAADIVRLPLQDTYSTTILLFQRADPPPTSVDPAAGRLTWDDALPGLGLTRMRPGQVLTVTTVFTALRSIDAAIINRAEVLQVRDEFGNEVVAPRRADVPIRILPGPTELALTPSAPTPQPEQPRQRRTATPVPTATSLIAAAPISDTAGITPSGGSTDSAGLAVTPAAPLAEATPAALPRTGRADSSATSWALIALALIALALIATGALAALVRHKRQT